MTHLKQTFLICAAAFAALGCGLAFASAQPAASDAKPIPPAHTQWRAQPVFENKVYFALPDGFGKEPVFMDAGPKMTRANFYPEGQTQQNWTEDIRVVGYPGIPPNTTTPAKFALDNLSNSLRNSCPIDFIYEPAVQTNEKRASAVMGCRKLGGTQDKSVLGYYLIVQGERHMYLVTHETRLGALAPKAALPKSLPLWQTQIDRTIVCDRGAECEMKEPADTIEPGPGPIPAPVPVATAPAAATPAAAMPEKAESKAK